MCYSKIPNLNLNVVLLLVLCCGSFCSSSSDGLETSSAYYGLVLTAAQRQNNGEKSDCLEKLTSIKNGVDGRERWALKLLDASGAPETRLYWGNTFWLGNRRQCEACMSSKPLMLSPALGEVTQETARSVSPHRVAYYAAYVQHYSRMKVQQHWKNESVIVMGLCLPSDCSPEEVASLLQQFFSSSRLHYQDIYNTSLTVKEVKKINSNYSWMLKPRVFFISLIFVTIFIACIFGTAYDLLVYQPLVEKNEIAKTKNEEKTGKNQQDDDAKNIATKYKILRCFSLYSNSARVFKTETTSNNLMPIHGMRFLSNLYVITNHSIFYMGDQYGNRAGALYLMDNFGVQFLTNSILIVDTFFAIGGYLLAYLYYQMENDSVRDHRKMTFKKRLALLFFATLHRFMRLTPLYLAGIGLAELNSHWRYHESPFFTTEKIHELCPKYWWRNILYINNFYPRDEMCLTWSWYLSNDMQFCIIFTFLLILSKEYFKTTVAILAAIFVGCATYTGYLTYMDDYKLFLDEQMLKMDTFYHPPWTRCGPYIAGMAAASFADYYGGKLPTYMTKKVKLFMWTLSISIILVMLVGMVDKNVSTATSVVYMSVGRTLWGLATSWFIIATLTGNANAMNKFFSYKVWVPLSRLSFCCYVLNPIVINMVATLNNSPWQAEIPLAIFQALGNTAFILVAAYFASITVEIPFILLSKLLAEAQMQKMTTDNAADFSTTATDAYKKKI